VAGGWKADWHAPIVAETYDGLLNDINGFHVQKEHVLAAIASARSGPVAEGSVGGGTGMVCHDFKGGIGTSSRRIAVANDLYTVGVLVQCNYGKRDTLRIAGAPAGIALQDRYLPCKRGPDETKQPECRSGEATGRAADGSIIVVIATDAPLLPHQLKRLSKRASLGLGRMGSIASAGSGDIFVAFSTANDHLESDQPENTPITMYSNERLTPLFEAVVDGTEEAILNAMVAADDMTGANGTTIYALPHDELRAIMTRWPTGNTAE